MVTRQRVDIWIFTRAAAADVDYDDDDDYYKD